MEKPLDRFLRYVMIDTQSKEDVKEYPSTEKQKDFLKLLLKELQHIGLKDAVMDDHGYVMATLPATTKKKVPVIGFLAHVDTSPEMPGDNVKPRIVKKYDGRDIPLDPEGTIILSPATFPDLKHHIGQTLVTTDGTTLLGADDKAGVAEIMALVEYLAAHPEIEHGAIRVAFTPDEEVGRGVDFFDVKKFGADLAYTIDGGGMGEIEYENFNAAGAKVNIQGNNIHPGYAKDKMVNAILLGMEFNALLPVHQRPESTVKYEGFFHLVKFEGSVEKAFLQYILRDHDKSLFESKKRYFQSCVDLMNQKYSGQPFTLELKDQYFNMREKVEPEFHVVENAQKAMVMAGIEPVIIPIRGGTDGARLSFMGLPCPNLFAGMHNFHGKYEFAVVEEMEKAVEVMLNIVRIYSNKE
ncbi:MAG: peptidase T [Bacteroidetes bacterium]|nr:peptidase T [Bacteroidota bacterium]